MYIYISYIHNWQRVPNHPNPLFYEDPLNAKEHYLLMQHLFNTQSCYYFESNFSVV